MARNKRGEILHDIRTLRAGAGYTQEQFGAAIGVSAATINRIESGMIEMPNLSILRKLSGLAESVYSAKVFMGAVDADQFFYISERLAEASSGIDDARIVTDVKCKITLAIARISAAKSPEEFAAARTETVAMLAAAVDRLPGGSVSFEAMRSVEV